MDELIFEVREADDGGYRARALGVDIFTQGETWEELRLKVREAVDCHFGPGEDAPKLVRLHFVKDEVLAL